jgi:hypothetical protein
MHEPNFLPFIEENEGRRSTNSEGQLLLLGHTFR